MHTGSAWKEHYLFDVSVRLLPGKSVSSSMRRIDTCTSPCPNNRWSPLSGRFRTEEKVGVLVKRAGDRLGSRATSMKIVFLRDKGGWVFWVAGRPAINLNLGGLLIMGTLRLSKNYFGQEMHPDTESPLVAGRHVLPEIVFRQTKGPLSAFGPLVSQNTISDKTWHPDSDGFEVEKTDATDEDGWVYSVRIELLRFDQMPPRTVSAVA